MTNIVLPTDLKEILTATIENVAYDCNFESMDDLELYIECVEWDFAEATGYESFRLNSIGKSLCKKALQDRLKELNLL